MSDTDSPLLHVRAAAWHVVKELEATGSCGRATLASLDHSLSVADAANVWQPIDGDAVVAERIAALTDAQLDQHLHAMALALDSWSRIRERANVRAALQAVLGSKP